MSKFFALAVLASVTVAAPAFAAHQAGHAPAPAKNPSAPAKQVQPAQAQYACPMRCSNEVAKAPGTCKVCGMALEKLPAKNK